MSIHLTAHIDVFRCQSERSPSRLFVLTLVVNTMANEPFPLIRNIEFKTVFVS